jgi:MOSC domain-containing protein YiiM
VQALLETLPQRGRLEGIVLRRARRGGAERVTHTEAVAGVGLVGDHRSTRAQIRPSGRQVSLIQAEHLPVIAALAGLQDVSGLPERLRRNLVVSGINLVALRGWRFRVGEAVLEGSGLCYPCSRMEAALGPGGYNAVRGHGGLLARVLTGGKLAVGDAVVPLERL